MGGEELWHGGAYDCLVVDKRNISDTFTTMSGKVHFIFIIFLRVASSFNHLGLHLKGSRPIDFSAYTVSYGVGRQGTRPRIAGLSLKASKWDKDIDDKIRREAAAQARPGETFAGAVLGSLLLGPFGGLFGASLGAGLGQRLAEDKARKKEMERLGLSPEMLDAAREIGEALERNMEGLSAVQESYETQKRFARQLESDTEALYAKAKEALQSADEERARKFLMQRTDVQNKLKEVLKTCATARRQVEVLEENTSVLQQRAVEIDSLLKRTVGAKAVENASALGLSLSGSDPLLDKFRDLGID
ncbi:hypothetical protein ACA910_005292 [Epithemia clementina (nom. ined.)]